MMVSERAIYYIALSETTIERNYVELAAQIPREAKG